MRSRLALAVPRRRREIVMRSGLRFQTAGWLDLLVLKETVLDDCYGVRALAASLDPETIVDVGAGIGDFAVLAAATFPSATVLALEPNPSSFRLLETNRRANHADNLKPLCAAVGTLPTVKLCVGRIGPLASTRRVDGGRAWLEVPAVRLDDALAGVRRVDLLKIDCEGSEIDALESAGALLQRVQHVVVEFHKWLLPDADLKVTALLMEHGFKISVVRDRYDPELGYVTGRRE
jgi:FkbM family methyltransferase